MIEKITCLGYRGFSTKQTLQLATPNGSRGSGLTTLIGPNGGGKSTLVECFSKLVTPDVSFTEGKRNKLAGDKIQIGITYDGRDAKLVTVEGGGSEVGWNGPVEKPRIYYLPSRRVFNPYFGKNSWDRDTFILHPENSQFRANPLNNFTYRLFDAQKKSKEFNKIFWRILGKKLDWTIDQDDTGNYYVKVKKDKSVCHNSDGLGEGIVSLLFIVDAIFEAKENELIVIDEPELSLHPQLQARLLNEILELTKTLQVVISTHSSSITSIESAINKGVIARVYEANGGSVISCIDDTCRGYFRSYYSNIYNPHIIGSDARSCFFAEDGFIITEGQEDVMLFPKILEQLDLPNRVPFFGFGAGGASCISQIAYILKCLGFSHIGAIFDGDKVADYEDFIKKYEDVGYKAWIIPADDIRDKPSVQKDFKPGLLDDKNILKPECDRGKLREMLNDIIQFSESYR